MLVKIIPVVKHSTGSTSYFKRIDSGDGFLPGKVSQQAISWAEPEVVLFYLLEMTYLCVTEPWRYGKFRILPAITCEYQLKSATFTYTRGISNKIFMAVGTEELVLAHYSLFPLKILNA
jgi:hypothetical protein